MAAKILIIEDHVLIRNVICKVLRNEGYKVMEASDQTHSLDLLQQHRFDLVIMDFMTPKVYGVKFGERLHTLQERVPIIFIRSQLSVISLKALLDDVAEVLPRPFEHDHLPSIRRPFKSTSH